MGHPCLVTVCGDQRSACGSQFSPSTMRSPEICLLIGLKHLFLEPSWAPHLIQHYPRYRPTWTEHINAPWCPCPRQGSRTFPSWPAIWLNTRMWVQHGQLKAKLWEIRIQKENAYVLNEWWRGSYWQTLALFWHGPSALFRVMLSYSSLCHFPEP